MQWFSMKTRPKKYGAYFITIKNVHGDEFRFSTAALYKPDQDAFFDEQDDVFPNEIILAWAYMIKPYQEKIEDLEDE